jgi:hypothetical protein
MSMTSQDFFAGAGRGEDDTEPFKFEKIGDALVGDIVHVPAKSVETQFGPRLPIQVRRDDGTVVTLWIKQGQMASAIVAAARKADCDGITVGGRLAVTWESEKPSGKGNPMKIYAAAYRPPAVDPTAAFPGAAPTADDLI